MGKNLNSDLELHWNNVHLGQEMKGSVAQSQGHTDQEDNGAQTIDSNRKNIAAALDNADVGMVDNNFDIEVQEDHGVWAFAQIASVHHDKLAENCVEN